MSWVIFCKTLTGKTITIQGVDGNAPVSRLQEKITEQEGIPVEQQQLVWAPRYDGPSPKPQLMESERSLVDYNIGNEDVLDLRLKLK